MYIGTYTWIHVYSRTPQSAYVYSSSLLGRSSTRSPNHFTLTVERRKSPNIYDITLCAILAKTTFLGLYFNGPPSKKKSPWNPYCQGLSVMRSSFNCKRQQRCAYSEIREVSETWHQKTVCKATILFRKPDTFHPAMRTDTTAAVFRNFASNTIQLSTQEQYKSTN